MKKITYGLGLLASGMFAVAIAHAQSGGGAGGGGAGGAGGAGGSGSSSASAGAAGTGTAGGTTGTSPAGSSGVGASSPSNLNTGGAGATGTGASAAGTRATGAGAGTGAAAGGFSTQGTGAGGAAGTPSGSGTTPGRASAGAAGAQNAQPGGTGLGTSGAAGAGLGRGAAGTTGTAGAAGTTGTTGGVGGFGTRGAAGLRSGTTFDTQRNLGVQGDFNQRTAAEQQLTIEQQRAAGLRTQQGDFNRTRSEFSDQSTLRTDMDRDAIDADSAVQSSQRAATTGAPGELGVFVNPAGDRGVLISRIVEGSAAALAGLQPGDIIVGVDEQLIAAPGDLTRIIRAIPAGEVAQLQVIRDGAEYDVDATLMPMRDRSVAVGYRGTESASANVDLASRVSRLEEQLDLVLDELRMVRREVVVLRGGSSEAGAGARYGERETDTSINGEFGARSSTETGTQFEQRETERGIGVGTEFDQRSSSEAGIGTDVNQREAEAGIDARSRTEAGASGTGSRLPPPPAGQRDRDAAGESAGQSPGANDDLFDTSDTDANRSDADQPATENEQDQQSATDANNGLPF